MSARANDKRNGIRIKKEFVVGVKTGSGIKVAYTIDVSRGGVKVGSPSMRLPLGEEVEVLLDKGGEKIPFTGQVSRDDGAYHLSRLGKSADAYFIRITDARFPEFASNNFYV